MVPNNQQCSLGLPVLRRNFAVLNGEQNTARLDAYADPGREFSRPATGKHQDKKDGTFLAICNTEHEVPPFARQTVHAVILSL